MKIASHLSLMSWVLFLCLISPSVSVDEDNVLSFFLIGDWGKGGASGAYGSVVVPGQTTTLAKDKTYHQLAVAQAMGLHAATLSLKPSFVIALGDNFYANGVSSSTDVLWSYLWKNVYLTNYPDLYIPWYPVFGNHDYGGSTDAQIQRFLDHSDDDIWMFESSYYLKTFSIPGGGSVAILFIDTTTLAPSENKCCNSKGGISATVQNERIEKQVAFIDRQLKAVTEDAERPTWLFVSGHYPVFSSGDNGDTSELSAHLQPLLEKYQVDAYFCGHDHISEHLQANGTDYYVAGAGSMTDGLKKTSKADLIWSGTGYSAFAVVNATLESYTVGFVDTSNVQRYSHTVSTQARNTRPPTMVPTLAPTFEATEQPTSMPTALPTASPSSVEVVPSNSRSDESFLEAIGRLFREGNPVVVVTGSLLSGSVLVMLAFLAYSRLKGNKGDSFKALRSPAADHPARYQMVARGKGGHQGSESQLMAGRENEDEETGNPLRSPARSSHVRSGSAGSYHVVNSPQRYVDIKALRSDLALDPSVFRASTGSGLSPPQFTRMQDTHPSIASDQSISDLTPPSDATSSTGSGPQQLKSFGAALRLKLFDVIARSITSEEIRTNTADGRIFQRVDSTVASPSHKRAATMKI